MTHVFTFDLPHETTRGRWRLEAAAGWGLLCATPFEVVPLEAYHGPVLDCAAPEVISLGFPPAALPVQEPAA